MEVVTPDDAVREVVSQKWDATRWIVTIGAMVVGVLLVSLLQILAE